MDKNILIEIKRINELIGNKIINESLPGQGTIVDILENIFKTTEKSEVNSLKNYLKTSAGRLSQQEEQKMVNALTKIEKNEAQLLTADEIALLELKISYSSLSKKIITKGLISQDFTNYYNSTKNAVKNGSWTKEKAETQLNSFLEQHPVTKNNQELKNALKNEIDNELEQASKEAAESKQRQKVERGLKSDLKVADLTNEIDKIESRNPQIKNKLQAIKDKSYTARLRDLKTRLKSVKDSDIEFLSDASKSDLAAVEAFIGQRDPNVLTWVRHNFVEVHWGWKIFVLCVLSGLTKDTRLGNLVRKVFGKAWDGLMNILGLDKVISSTDNSSSESSDDSGGSVLGPLIKAN